MEHIPAKESYVQKVVRIAKELDISIDKASITCDAFELAFSDLESRRSIFEIIDQLDYEAYKKGEPLGMILSYAVELGMDGIHVSRHANEIPPGQVVSLTPTNRAMIFVRIKDHFPTQQFLGPLIVNRPEIEFDTEIDKLPSLARRSTGQSYGQNEGWQPAPDDGVVCSDGVHQDPGGWTDGEITESAIPTDFSSLEPDTTVICLGPSSLESPTAVICLGPIRLKFKERFSFISRSASETLRARPTSCFGSARRRLFARPLAVTASHSGQFPSGLSPPLNAENLGHSERKMFLRHWQ